MPASPLLRSVDYRTAPQIWDGKYIKDGVISCIATQIESLYGTQAVSQRIRGRAMAHNAAKSLYARPAKSKSVTFTGCWTCRSRKVKCDERQNDGCGVCERAGLDCAGYEVNLCWVTDQKRDWQGLRRRGIKPSQFTSPTMSDDEIIKKLSAIDAISAPSSTVTMGPFAIFQADQFSRHDKAFSRPSSTNSEYLESPASGAYGRQGHGSSNMDVDTYGQRQHSHYAMEFSEFSMHHEIPNVERSDTLEELDEADSPASQPHVDSSISSSIQSTLAASSSTEVIEISSPHLGLSMPLFRDSQISRLMHHYTNHVAELLQPVLHPRNPWRTTYFSFALEGSPDLLSCQKSTTSSSYASMSLFHSLLSAAAFHLRNASNDSTEFHRLALQHRIRALQALNSAAKYPSNPQVYIVYLTAMLSLVTVDTMAGEDSDFPIHLRGCYQLRKPPGYSSMYGGSASEIYSICRFLTLLARTTSPVIVARPWPIDGQAAFDLPHFRSNERSVEYLYGITPTLGDMLGKTCQIAEHLAFYQVRGEEFPAPLRDACKSLGDKIFSWAIDSEPFCLIDPEESTMREIARCQARAFHGAVLIYYYRTLQKNGLDTVVVDVERKVQSIWEDLTTAEDLKDAYMGGSKRSAPMSWPAFIAACEATDRQRWIEWWERVNGYHIGNFTRQWKIIRELWSIQDTDKSRISCRDALARVGKLVLPI